MAEAIFAPITGAVLTGTSGDDIITLDSSVLAGINQVNVGAGNDTVIFDGILGTAPGAGVFGFSGGGQFTNAAGDYIVTGFETLQFANGTITSNASVVPERVLAGSITGSITALGGDANGNAPADGSSDFNLGTLLDWNGTAVTTNAGAWTIESIEGQAAGAGANITVVENGVIQGRVAVNGTNNGIEVTAENAFHTGITEIGGTRTMSVDVVLTDGAGGTFSETLSVNVVGVASDAANTFAGTTGDDTVDALGGNDSLRGGAGDDRLFGNDGDDEIFAGAGDAGADSMAGGDGDDVIGGGAGNDLIIGDSDRGNLIGGGFAFGAPADDGSDLLFGGDGDDVIWTGNSDGTGSADDVAWAGAGDDAINGAGGNDSLGGGDGDDTVLAGAGDDTVFGGDGDDFIDGEAGADLIFAGAGDDTVVGGTGADEIFNGAGDDTVDGGADDDIIWGGAGNDSLIGNAGDDVFLFEVGNGNDTIADFTTGDDLVDFSGITGVGSLTDFVIVTEAGNTTVFYGETDSVTFTGVVGLTDADFLFA